MGVGETDRLLLIGHANGIAINDPHQVINMQETINLLGADGDSPLVRGLLEAYNSGCRDIWVMAAAPMAEYMPFEYSDTTTRTTPRDEWNGLTFYQQYSVRLNATYELLLQYDFPEIVVPIEAPFYDSGNVDFLTPLIFNCYERFRRTGSASIGIVGTRIGNEITAAVDNMVNDIRINVNGQYSTQRMVDMVGINYGSQVMQNVIDGSFAKFGMVVVGEGTLSLPQMDTPHVSSLAVAAAAQLATRRMDKGLTYAKLRNVISVTGPLLSDEDQKRLAQMRLNPAIKTIRGKRGGLYNIVLATDNTLSEENSDFWSVVQMRLVSKVMQKIRALGNRVIGTINYPQFKTDVYDYLNILTSSGAIRGYDLNIYRGDDQERTVFVELALRPYHGVRELFFTVEVGPGV
jgi:hypothetical protein